jgi:hypothetical protein
MPKLTSRKRLLVPKSLAALYRERGRALERVVALCEQNGGEDSDELNRALDVLAIAHTAATFEWASNSLIE